LNENDVDDDEPPVAKYAMPGEKHNNWSVMHYIHVVLSLYHFIYIDFAPVMVWLVSGSAVAGGCAWVSALLLYISCV
jgi:hypothetical protein